MTTVEINIMRTATPWFASSCADSAVVTGMRAVIAPTAWQGTPGITADGAAKLRQEKTAPIQACLGQGVARRNTTDLVLDHPAAFGRGPVVDPQTTSTAYGVVQGPPPWRHPVIT
ncbi:hypothetical protein ABGB17_32785 [Sphaerisporangium sp. B11E5]|uniref:hypothetical protein n=1 Tax=Sphaerisporangium sp. B11E5 TaxID=3153563 RepID=UPI00325DD944